MKIKVEIEIEDIPKVCKDCRFIILKINPNGRHYIKKYNLTDIGDSYCEGYLDQNIIEIYMREGCPILLSEKGGYNV